jgi:hypothetical protein
MNPVPTRRPKTDGIALENKDVVAAAAEKYVNNRAQYATHLTSLSP